MKTLHSHSLLHRAFLFLLSGLYFAEPVYSQDWLTPLELEQYRDIETSDKRIAFYMKVARQRMKTARARLAGEESKPKDPLEFFSVTDLTNGCFQALHTSMYSIQDQIEYRHIQGPELTDGLKELRKGTKEMQPFFQEMQKVALEKKDETLYKITVEGLKYADSALRGIEKALKKYEVQKDSGFLSDR